MKFKAHLSTSTTLLHLARALAGSAGLRVIGMGLAFLVGIQLARGLGADGYGVYGVAMSAIALLIVPAEFGMPQLLIREIAAAEAAGNWGRMRGVVDWANRSAWILSLIVAAGLAAWILLTDPHLKSPLSLTLLCAVLLVPAVTLGRQRGAALFGLHHIVKAQVPDAVVRPAVFSLLLLAVHFCLGSLSPVLAMALGACSAGFALIVVHAMFKRAWPAAARHARPEIDARSWWTSAVPMALTEGMRSLQGNVATLVMGLVATTAATGIFRVANSISIMVSVPVGLFALVGAPTISRLHARGDKRSLRRLIAWLTAGMTLGSALLAAPFLFAGEPLLQRLFGTEFVASNLPLLILCGGGILYAALGPALIVLNMTGHERHVTRAFVASLIVLLVLALPLVHLYGAVGAASASAAAMVIGNGLMWRDVRHHLAIDTSLLAWLPQRMQSHV